MNIYDFTVRDNRGNDVSLERYRGKVLLVVNTATKCGLTPQYEQLEALYAAHGEQGLEVLDFPCNQFLHQAPGSDEEIDSFCKLTYHTNFPRFAKIDVNGKDAHPLYQWLREQAPEDKRDPASADMDKKLKLLRPMTKAGEIGWNFGKFLIDRQGNVAGRYAPTYPPEKLASEIEALL